MPPSTPTDAIDLAEASNELQPRELIVTLFGLYARDANNWLSVASLVRLMADLDVDGPAVRSSISRLKRRDVLLSVRHDAVAGYSLSQGMLTVISEGDTRIFGRRRATMADGWLVVVFSVPESERDKRHQLRTVLTRLGFGTAAPGVWIGPGSLGHETRETLRRAELSGYVDLFLSEHFAFGELAAKVGQWWDLDELSLLYADFITRYRPTLEAISAAVVTPRDAFVNYVPMLTQWRRLPYRDPGLPLNLLPPDWNGVTAEQLFSSMNDAFSGPAREHALAMLSPR